jgi:hypothetical protein
MKNTLDQLYQTKAQLIAILSAAVGIGLLMLARWQPAIAWLSAFPVPIPLSELGGGFFGFGVLGIYFQVLDRTAGDRRTKRDLREAVRAEAPAIRDTVLDSFAFDPKTLKGIASEETLDRITTNALGLRIGDMELAQDLYTDVREQVVRAPERWRDVDVAITLSPSAVGPVTGRGSMFTATIRWAYRVKPASNSLRFACVSDLDEYREMLRDPAISSAWHFDPSPEVDAGSQDAFELLQLAVDGHDCPIRRSARRESQLYTVSLGADATEGEVTISYTYRVLVKRHGHVLYLDLPRPTKGLHIQLSYAGADLRRVTTLDFIASSESSRVDEAPPTVPARTVDVNFDGWIFPRSGVAFVWVLEAEFGRSGTGASSKGSQAPPQ